MNTPALNAEEIARQALRLGDENVRREFVERHCEADRSIRQAVERLILDGSARPSSLEETADSTVRNNAAIEVPEAGTKIGPYQLLEEIGEGGMGVVFLAQQTEPISRRVALKVIKVGMDTRRVVARFESERQTMALLDHPSITKVLDAGATDSGRPYFVMELVEGRPLTKYCDAQRLSIPRRLKIFIQICNAVEHAHQKGIIHRDIKPNNIIVTEQDGNPLPKIIDFGIAKATADRTGDETAFTRLGEMVGTPLYMSPEQASDEEVDTRADIYSLGVVLYELLTGTTPFHDLRRQKVQDIRAAIRTKDPPTASHRVGNLGETAAEIAAQRDTDPHWLARSIKGELDWILLKCLARDREQRYQSAGELAREIRRYLRGEPIDAAAPTFWYRSRKFIGKHRVAVGVTTFVVALLTAASVFSSWLAYRANALARRATEAESLAKSRLVEVEEQRDRAMAAEKQLAKLEREQRNRVAISQAAARHNADMFRKYMSKSRDSEIVADGTPLRLIPLNSVWQGDRPPPPVPSATSGGPPVPPAARMETSEPSGPFTFSMANSDPANDLEVVVCPEDPDCEESMLKSILAQQMDAFGKDDVVVAVTLNRLGEIMSQKEKWGESAEYFAEAVEILKETTAEHPELGRIRDNLAKVLKNQGDVGQALNELQAAKAALQDLDVQENLKTIWNKVKDGLEKKKAEEEK
jgi:serine/threonine protein kinase